MLQAAERLFFAGLALWSCDRKENHVTDSYEQQKLLPEWTPAAVWFVQDVSPRGPRCAPGPVCVRAVGRGVSAGHRDAFPPGVFLQGGEGAERAVGLQG